jgi:hypothetical protein
MKKIILFSCILLFIISTISVQKVFAANCQDVDGWCAPNANPSVCKTSQITGSCSTGLFCCKNSPTPTPIPDETPCKNKGGYCIHNSPQVCGSGQQTLQSGLCGSGAFDRCCIPPTPTPSTCGGTGKCYASCPGGTSWVSPVTSCGPNGYCCIPNATPTSPPPPPSGGSSGASSGGTTSTSSSSTVKVVSKTVPDWVKNLSCQTVKDQNDWNTHPNSREFPAKGVVDNGTWPQLWDPYGCVRTWCDNNELYAYYTWNSGYTDTKAQSNYQIYNWSTSLPNNNITIGGIGGNTNAVVDYGASSTWNGKWVFAQVINGYNEWGYPGVGVGLTCSAQPTVAPTAVPTVPASGTTITPTTNPSGQLTVGVSLVVGSIDTNDAQTQRQPKHQTRRVTLYFYSSNNYTNDYSGSKAIIAKGDVTFTGGDPNDPLSYGTFSNPQFTLPKAIQPGNYFIFGKIEGSLRQSFNNPPAPIDISNGTFLFFAQPFVMGEVVSTNNQIQATDYQTILTCYGAQSNSVSSDCANLNMGDDIFSDIPWLDLNDDGIIDGIDYNILIRNFGKHGL